MLARNIILILIDQCRVDRLHAHPIFADLKGVGSFFDNVIAYAPYTIASMHAIFSGMYGMQNGVNGYYKSSLFDTEGVRTLATYLQANGYYTKADLFNKLLSPSVGFDEFLIHDEHEVDLKQRHEGLLKEMANRGGKNLLYLHYGSIHTANSVSVVGKYDDFSDEYFKHPDENLIRYDKLVAEAGDYLQHLWSCARAEGLTDDSLFIVLTDHGCSVGERVGEKVYGVYVYDYTIRTFVYLIGPNIPIGKQFGFQVRTIDILPTVLEALGIPVATDAKPIQGQSLFPILWGEETGHREAYAETGGLGGPFPSPDEPNVKCVRTGEWKLIYNTTTGERELYHLSTDKDERVNLADKHPEIEKELWQTLVRYNDY